LDKGSGFRFQGSASGFSVHDWECRFWVSALGFLGFRVSGFGSQGVGGRAYLPRGCPSISLAVGDIGGPQRLVRTSYPPRVRELSPVHSVVTVWSPPGKSLYLTPARRPRISTPRRRGRADTRDKGRRGREATVRTSRTPPCDRNRSAPSSAR